MLNFNGVGVFGGTFLVARRRFLNHVVALYIERNLNPVTSQISSNLDSWSHVKAFHKCLVYINTDNRI